MGPTTRQAPSCPSGCREQGWDCPDDALACCVLLDSPLRFFHLLLACFLSVFSQHKKVQRKNMAEIFEGYEREYCELSASISRNVTALESSSGGARKDLLTKTEKEIEEAGDLLQQMTLEARAAVKPVKDQLMNKLANYTKDHTKAKADFKRASLNTNAAGAAVAGGALFAGEQTNAEQRQRMLNATDRLKGQKDRVAEARRTVAETEEVGQGIISNLATQRDTIENAGGHLRETNTDISRSGRILTYVFDLDVLWVYFIHDRRTGHWTHWLSVDG